MRQYIKWHILLFFEVDKNSELHRVQYEKIIRLSAMKGRDIPAQGNALGFEINVPKIKGITIRVVAQ